MIRLSHVLFALIGMTGVALAQDPAAPPPPPPSAGPPAPAAPEPQGKIGADLAFVLPVDDYADGITAALGLFGRFEYAISPQVAVTGRLGFLYHIIDQPEGDVDLSLTMIPIYGGIKYNLNGAGDGVFLSGEAGINNIRVSASTMGIEISDSQTKLSLNLGGGYQAGKISLRGSLFFTADAGGGDGVDGTNLVGLMASVGYDFVAL